MGGWGGGQISGGAGGKAGRRRSALGGGRCGVAGGCSAAWSAWVQGGGRAERPAARRPAKRAPPRRVSPAWCTAEWAAWAATAAGGRAAAWLRVLRPWGGPGGAESGGLGGLVLAMRLLDALGKPDCQVAVTQAGGGWGAMRGPIQAVASCQRAAAGRAGGQGERARAPGAGAKLAVWGRGCSGGRWHCWRQCATPLRAALSKGSHKARMGHADGTQYSIGP